MPVFGTREHGQVRRRPLRLPDGFAYHKGEWLESTEGPGRSPTVFLIEQPAGASLATHFHLQNEFQVVVEGGGTLGRHTLDAPAVHYAGAYTGYGPLVAGPAGLKYFTIRAVFDTGALFMPQARERLVRGPKRHAELLLDEKASRPFERLLDDAGDALTVSRVVLDGGQRHAVSADPSSDGLFVFVLSGAVRSAERTVSRWECVYCAPGEDALEFEGMPGEAADLLLMQMPPLDPAYRPPQPA
jgi:hypothetical protein